jgi:hypothetical protein
VRDDEGPGTASVLWIIWASGPGVRSLETFRLPGAAPFDADIRGYPVLCWPTTTGVREAARVPGSSAGEGVWRTGESTRASANLSARPALERVRRSPFGPNGRSGTAGTAASRLPLVLLRARPDGLLFRCATRP